MLRSKPIRIRIKRKRYQKRFWFHTGLINSIETFAGLKALPQTARDIIQSVIDDRLRESLEKVAREARRYADTYRRQAKIDAEPVLLVEPTQRRGRRKGLSNRQKADYWDGLEQVIRSHIPRDWSGS